MVKTLTAIAISLVAGVALGFGANLWEFKKSGDYFLEALDTQQRRQSDADEDDDSGGRLAVLKGQSFDFGVMDQAQTGRHTFQVKNVGEGPLTMALLQTTCTCTTSDMAEGRPVQLEPGEIKDVTLEWKPKVYSRNFSQAATLRTSDPEHRVFRLIVEGRVVSSLSLVPDNIVFSDLSNKEPATRLLRVYSTVDENLQCEHVHQVKPELEQYFDVKVSPLSVEEVAAVDDCKSGLLVEVTAKPGIPLGPFRQTVSLTTNRQERSTIDFDIEGNVEGDVSIWTREKYSQRQQVLSLGLVKRGEQRQAELQILVKGKYDVTLDQSSIDPSEVLKARVGQPVAMNQSARRFPLTIEVDAGDYAISRLARAGEDNYGKVVLKTTHPDAPQIVIRVAFATGG